MFVNVGASPWAILNSRTSRESTRLCSGTGSPIKILKHAGHTCSSIEISCRPSRCPSLDHFNLWLPLFSTPLLESQILLQYSS